MNTKSRDFQTLTGTTMPTCAIITIGSTTADIFAATVEDLLLDVNGSHNGSGIASIEMQERSLLRNVLVTGIGLTDSTKITNPLSTGLFVDNTLKGGSTAGAGNFDLDNFQVRALDCSAAGLCGNVSGNTQYGIYFKSPQGAGPPSKPIGHWKEVSMKSACVSGTCTTGTNTLQTGIYLVGAAGGDIFKFHNEGVDVALKYGDSGVSIASQGVTAEIEGDDLTVATWLDGSSTSAGYFKIAPTGGTLSTTHCAILDRFFSPTGSPCVMLDNFTSNGTFNYVCCGHNYAIAANLPKLTYGVFATSSSVASVALTPLFDSNTTPSWTLPLNTTWTWHCSLIFEQSGATEIDGFGVATSTAAPQELDGEQLVYGQATTPTTPVVGTIAVTTVTNQSFTTFTPNAINVKYQAYLDGGIFTNASGPMTFRIEAKTAVAAHALKFDSGSFCTLSPVN